jgi:hypothetical protein
MNLLIGLIIVYASIGIWCDRYNKKHGLGRYKDQ